MSEPESCASASLVPNSIHSLPLPAVHGDRLRDAQGTACVLITLYYCQETPPPKLLLQEKAFSWGFAYSLRVSVYYHRGRNQISMVQRAGRETVTGSDMNF